MDCIPGQCTGSNAYESALLPPCLLSWQVVAALKEVFFRAEAFTYTGHLSLINAGWKDFIVQSTCGSK